MSYPLPTIISVTLFACARLGEPMPTPEQTLPQSAIRGPTAGGETTPVVVDVADDTAFVEVLDANIGYERAPGVPLCRTPCVADMAHGTWRLRLRSQTTRRVDFGTLTVADVPVAYRRRLATRTGSSAAYLLPPLAAFSAMGAAALIPLGAAFIANPLDVEDFPATGTMILAFGIASVVVLALSIWGWRRTKPRVRPGSEIQWSISADQATGIVR